MSIVASVRLVNPTLTTPKAPCIWPKVYEPDTKFKEEGEYSISVILTPEQAEPIIATAQNHLDTFVAEQSKLMNSKKPLRRAAVGAWKPDTDKDGNETGNVRMSFKMKASTINKKTGHKMEFKPAIFDKYGKPTSDVFGSGSAVKVNFEVFPWFTPALGAGISFRLRAVQLHEIRQNGGGSSNAKDYGFSAEIPSENLDTFSDAPTAEVNQPVVEEADKQPAPSDGSDF